MAAETRAQFLHPDGRPGGSDMRDSFFTSRYQDALAWARKFAFFQYPFVTACCGMEYMSVTGPRFDTDRFGMTLPRFTPRQSDLLLVVGTITHRQAPILRRVWEQMSDPKWVAQFKLVTEGPVPPVGEVYQAVEGGNGELGFYLVSDGTGKPYKCRARSPSFSNTQSMPRMVVGGMLADVIPTFDMINMIGGECDR